MIHEKREKWREERETEKDRKDTFKCNNITKKCAKWREVKIEREREGVRQRRFASLKLYNS